MFQTATARTGEICPNHLQHQQISDRSDEVRDHVLNVSSHGLALDHSPSSFDMVFLLICLLLASHETMSTKPNQSIGRRRKVRCNFSPEHPIICKRCIKYNLECVDPAQQISDAGTEDRKTLRERVSRLEERLDAVQKGDLPSNVTGNQITPKRGFLEDDETDLDATSPMAPLIAVLQGSTVSLLVPCQNAT